jgi:hypothetical protein
MEEKRDIHDKKVKWESGVFPSTSGGRALVAYKCFADLLIQSFEKKGRGNKGTGEKCHGLIKGTGS